MTETFKKQLKDQKLKLGETFKAERKKLKLTPAKVEGKLKRKITNSQIKAIESGTANYTIDSALLLCEFYKIKTLEL